MTNPKAVGEMTEAAILNHLTQKGVPVSIPWGNNQRYDMIIEDGDRLLKAQCKTGTYTKGAVTFSCSSRSGGKVRKDYTGQVDCFLVYCKELGKLYKIVIGEATKSAMSLRVDTLNKYAPKSNIKWAKDYEI